MNLKSIPLLTIGEVAKRSGVAASALRFYEEKGLIFSIREPGARRRFHRATLRRVAFIVFAQKIGLSLEQVKAELATLPRGRAPTEADWERISKTWKAALAERITELRRMEDGLTTCIGCGCLSLAKCQFVNPADRFAALGPGPRMWIARKVKK